MKVHTRNGPRLCAGLVLVVLALTAMATPALAGSRGHSRSSGSFASTQWLEWGTLPGIGGNVHVGDLFVDAATSSPYVYGNVFDWTCPDGVRPPDGGGHGDPIEENPCTLESVRFLYGDGSTLSFSMDRKLNEATLTGTISVSDHGGGTLANPPVNIVWTGTGSTVSVRYTESYTDGSYTYFFRYRASSRSATMTGSIGAMGFTDDADDESSGYMGSYSDMQRWRST